MKPDMMKPGVALVTGGAVRIGRAIVERLAAEGHAVVIHCNGSRAAGEALAAELTARGAKAGVVTGDLADPVAVDAIWPAASALFGPVDILVNNASTFLSDRIETLDVLQWNRQFSVNLRAPMMLAKALAAGLPPGAHGVIINIVDQRVWKLTPEHFSYTLAKSALFTATRTLAQALAPRIRVNAVGPGPTVPNPHDGTEGFEHEARNTLLARGSSPAEIAEAVAFLVNAQAVTGQMIAVDGGQHLNWRTPDIVP
jgi:NAD(P)-dependent dehydrogenase (short-subunit alcohol dehydrogenase family)